MKRDSIAIPVAIVIAAGLIAGAIYLNGAKAPAAPLDFTGGAPTEPTAAAPAKPVVLPVTDKDHIRGNPKAPIMLVEYSDFDCPFCKQYHETMTRIMEEYGPSGKVAWAYRHFPLEQLHPNAPKIAEASECVADLGGDPAFWKFADLVFGERATNAQTDMTRLPDFAASAGVDKAAFESCLSSGKFTEAITQSIQEAVAAGGRGTPHTLVLVGEQSGAINGAQPYEAVKGIIDNLIKQIDAGTPLTDKGA
jgi:protein-disulfide isomerase